MPKKAFRLRLVLLAVAVAVVFSAGGYLFLKDRMPKPNLIYKGISIDGVDVSGLTSAGAAELIEKKYGLADSHSVVLRHGEKSWKLELKDISYEYQTEEAVKKAISLNKGGGFLDRLKISILPLNNIVDIPLYSHYDMSALRQKLVDISREIDTEGKNAVIVYEKGVLKKEKEVLGKKLNIDRSLREIDKKISKKDFSDIELIVDETKPQITMADIEPINGVLSEFYTNFNASQRNRRDNIKHAVDTIDDTLILPGETFSMNQALGPRTPENGYKKAPIILNNKMVEGTGGGVCQVTTTLYNCVLKAGLEVVERTPHSRTLGYISPGQDATIAGESVDFKFKNNQKNPVLLSTEVAGGTIYMKILGNKENLLYEYRLISDIIKVIKPGKPKVIIDNSLEDGETVWVEKPKNGIRAVVYRDAYDAQGKLVKREKISTDYYRPVNGILKANSRYNP